MKTSSIFKKVAVTLTSIAAVTMFSTVAVSAIAYQGDQTVASPVPAFNVFTGVPAPVGNENDFLRGRTLVNNNPMDATTQYGDSTNASCDNGQVLQLRVYVHNGASQYSNDNGNGASVAHGTKVKVAIPGTEATNFTSNATISATNAASVSDTASINCGTKKVKLSYIAGSASQYSIGSGVVQLSDSIVTDGVAIQSEKVAGDVWGCWNERVYVVLSVKVNEVKPPVVTPPAPVLACTIDSNKFIFDKTKRSVDVTITPTATNATVTGYSINWGDSTPVATTQTANHVYASSVKTATVTASFTATYTDANGKTITQTVSGENCAKAISFDSTPPPVIPPVTPPVTPPTTTTTTTSPPSTPAALPNTGAGNIAALFGAAAVIGTLGYRFILGRRLA
jgi:hypothetical protein